MAIKESMTFVVAVNNRQVFEDNIANSPPLKDTRLHEIIIKERYSCASRAYNEGLKEAKNDIVVFVHQDVCLPDGWDVRLVDTLNKLEKRGRVWGVVGCFGVDHLNRQFGHVYSNGLKKTLGDEGLMANVETLDELLLVVRKSSGIKFDGDLPNFHLYGTDICLSAQQSNMKCYAISNYCIHNSLPGTRLPKDYWVCVDYIRKKWRNRLPINTCVIRISKYDILHLGGKFIRHIQDYRNGRREDCVRRMNRSEINENLRRALRGGN